MADVLIVEDTGLQAALIKGFLSGTHSVVGTAGTAARAVERTVETAPDAVVMDLRLAAGDGIEATREITATRPATGVVISTVTVDPDTQQRALEAGADEYLTKPYTRADLLTAIEESLA
jgi:two-component system chemotaxis response regulator CheY